MTHDNRNEKACKTFKVPPKGFTHVVFMEPFKFLSIAPVEDLLFEVKN